MLTLPAILTDYARDGNGGGFVYALEILPSTPDAWLTKRFATAAVTIDGDEYGEALAKNITRISERADIIQAGGAAVLPDLTARLINKERLHEEFVADNVVNRKARLLLTALSSNRVLNSSFESATAAVPDHWTMHASLVGGTCAQSGAQYYDGTHSCLVQSTNAGEGSWIECDSMAAGWRRGEEMWFSAYARQVGAGDNFGMAIKTKLGGTWWYYNNTTRTWGMSRTVNWLGTTSATWKRFSVAMSYARLTELFSGTRDDYNAIVLEFWTQPNEGFYIDAVQAESWPGATPTGYHHNRHELVEADDCITVFTGIIKRPKWRHNEMGFQLEAYQANKHCTIPKTLLTDAISSTWEIPKDTYGEPFPMTYGDFQGNAHTVWNTEEPTLTEFARGLIANTDPDHADGMLAYFDSPSVGLYHPGGGIFRFYHYNEGNNRYYEQMYNDAAAYAYDAREFTDDLASNARWQQSSGTPYWLPLKKIPLMAAIKGAKREINAAYWSFEGNACDGDLGSKAMLQAGYDSAILLILENFPFDPDCIIRRSNSDVDAYLLADFYGFNGNLVTNCNYNLRALGLWNPGCPTTTLFTNKATPFNWRNVPIKRGAAATQLLTDAKFNITDWNVFKAIFPTAVAWFWINNDASSEVWLYEIGALFYFTIVPEDFVPAAQLYGRTFQDTWGGRKTATSLVQSPAETIESIIRIELGCVTADINTTEFDAVHTVRSSNKTAGQLHELTDSKKVVDKICAEHGLLYHVDVLGQHGLLALDHATAVVDTLGLGDFLLPHRQLIISQTPREAVINNMRVYYDKNQFTGEFRKLAYCDRNGRSGSIGASYQTKCSDSYTEMGNREQSYELECDWVNDTATAELIVKWFVDWNHRQRYMVDGYLFMDKYKIELGDIVALDIASLLPPAVTAAGRFMMLRKDLNRSKGLVQVQLLEVRAP